MTNKTNLVVTSHLSLRTHFLTPRARSHCHAPRDQDSSPLDPLDRFQLSPPTQALPEGITTAEPEHRSLRGG